MSRSRYSGVFAAICLLIAVAVLMSNFHGAEARRDVERVAAGGANEILMDGARILRADKVNRHRSLLADEEDESEAEPEEEEADEEEPVDDVEDEAEDVLEDEADGDVSAKVMAATCPIDLASTASDGMVMGEFLETLVTPCTVTGELDADASKAFCTDCVRPLQTFLAREFHLADLMRGAEETWDASNTDIHEKCAMDATDYLNNTGGMPYGEPFHVAVLACANFAEDPNCKFDTAELLASDDVKAAIDSCQEHKESIIMPTLDPEGIVKSTVGGSEEHPFCKECYWPFFEAVVKKAMSDEFVCQVQDSELTGIEMEKAVLEDPHMFACLLNIEGHLRENDMQSASIGYTNMEAICFNDLNHPQPNSTDPVILTWIGHDDMKDRLDSLDCPDAKK